MKVAWLLAAFIAIVTYTQMWAKLHMSAQNKSLPQFLFLQIKGHYEVP